MSGVLSLSLWLVFGWALYRLVQVLAFLYLRRVFQQEKRDTYRLLVQCRKGRRGVR